MTYSKNNFEALIKDKAVLKSISDMGLTQPTEIQIKTIPLILDGKNIIAQSATGTGKTIAFLAGILPSLTKQRKVQCLIIVPTRELANQVYEETIKLAKNKGLQACVVFGGASIFQQSRQLKYADIVIGTPGRIIDQIDRNNFILENIKHLVLDEADRMCDMGFFPDISKIIMQVPEKRQTLLFSATVTKDISTLEKKYIPNAKKITVKKQVDPINLLQEYYVVKPAQKFSLLLHLVKKHSKKAIVFSNTRNEVDAIYNTLNAQKIECYRLHGGLEQNKRSNTIKRYHQHPEALLISSDVAARGIHVDNIEYIYNYDLPKEDSQYIHRIGRTARAGKKGKAISIIVKKEQDRFVRLCKKYGFVLKEVQLPVFDVVDIDRKKSLQKEESNNQRPYRAKDRKERGRRTNFDKPSSENKSRFNRRKSSSKKGSQSRLNKFRYSKK